jgi:hypothetical protein
MCQSKDSPIDLKASMTARDHVGLFGAGKKADALGIGG